MEHRAFKKQMIPKNSGKRFKPTGIVLHETANPGASAQNHYTFFSKHTKTNAHAFIDWLEDLQIIPWDIVAWHAGRTANNSMIGVEMCRPKSHDPVQFNIVYWATVDAFARLFRWVLGVREVTEMNLMSHHEVTLKWKESTHTDPTGLFKEYGKTMDGFRADVQFRLDQKWEGQ